MPGPANGAVDYSHIQLDETGIADNTSKENNEPFCLGTMPEPSTDARHATFNNVGRDQYNITYANQTSEVKEILASLKPVDRGGYYVPPCMKGTREKIFEEIDRWLDDANAPNILWICGNPGAGKSTIASSLVSRLTDRRRMGSSFFFKRGDAALSDPASVWRSMAYDLAQHDSYFASHLAASVKGRSVLHERADIAMHFKFLIKMPLMKSYEDSPPHTIPVIVIDALDECESQKVQRKHLLDTLAQWSHFSKTFKLVVTSRVENFISTQFRPICKHMTLSTGDSVSAEANKDIRLFFEERFSGVADYLSSEWPWKRVLDVLTTRAAGLFIWAETVVRFVEQGLPGQRLELVLRGDLGNGDDITNLYRQVLHLSLPQADRPTLEVFKQVVATIVFAKSPILAEDVQELVAEPHSSVIFIVDKLSSVISVGEQDKRLRIGHLSFCEFLCDRQQCPEEFLIERDKESQKLAMTCFRVMKDRLKFNICDLESSHLLNSQVKDLSRRMEKNISTALLYACRFWAAHLRDTSIGSDASGGLIKEVQDFLHHRLLFWLEVMSLHNDLAAANVALLTLAASIKVVHENLAAIAQDSSRFVVQFDIPISASTPHIYVSALPFSPPDCFVAKQYQTQFSNSLSVLSGGDQHWPALLNIFRGHTGFVCSVAFSSDGKHVVSGSYDHTIRVWDARIGELVAGPFEGHTKSVRSVAISPDGKRVASGSADCTIRMWDVETGDLVADPFEGHTDKVWSVAFSPDGKRVVSGSADHTIRIWDAGTGENIAGPFEVDEGHRNSVMSVAFSTDGMRVVSGSAYYTVCIWDVRTAELVSAPFKGHTSYVWSVAFSPDGQRVVSGSSDCTVRIWDAETGKLVAGPFEGHTNFVWSVAFSPDGQRVVSGSHDHTVRIWDAETGTLLAGPFEGHTDKVWSVAFSPDGLRVVSGSSDRTIRIWDAGIGQTVAGPFHSLGTTPTISSTFSPTRRKVTSNTNATSNTIARVWDVKTGQVITFPFAGHTDTILSDTSSRDVTLRIKNTKIGPFRTPSGFLGRDAIRGGWVYCSNLVEYGVLDQGLLFWVPETCRQALCGPEMLFVFRKRTTRLDLGRFAHGVGWMQCRSSHRPSLPLDNPAPSDSSTATAKGDGAYLISNGHPQSSKASLASFSVSVYYESGPSYVRYLQNIALICVGLVAGYYVRALTSKL